MPKPAKTTIDARPTRWDEIILVCRKCSKKLDGGFGPGGEDTFSRDLKRTLRAAGRGRTSRVIETKCLGICPKGAVTVLQANAPGTILTVPAGADTASLLPRLRSPQHLPPT